MPTDPRRRWVNVFLVGFLAVLAIDAFRTCNPTHQALKDAVDLPLDVTGLWQGPWRLYAPDVDKDNLRLKADVVFRDQTVATYSSPDWSQRSALDKLVAARHMNYFNNLLVAGREPAWDALSAYLARTLRHSTGAAIAVDRVELSLRGAIIPPPGPTGVPAGPHLKFDDWQVIWTWRPST